jgi:hypothetical protein
MLTQFSVVHEAGDFEGRGTLIHCFDGPQMVLAVVTRTALDDYFPKRRLTNSQRNLLVDRHIEQFERIVTAKYEASAIERYKSPITGQTFPLVVVTAADLAQSSAALSDSVLDIAAAAGFHGRIAP